MWILYDFITPLRSQKRELWSLWWSLWCLVGGKGGWNSSGCFFLNKTDNELKCSCNHLTSFAVLMVSINMSEPASSLLERPGIKAEISEINERLWTDFCLLYFIDPCLVSRCSCVFFFFFFVKDISRDVMTDKLQGTILTFITYIGCGISAIFLAITLLTYLAFEWVQNKKNFIIFVKNEMI